MELIPLNTDTIRLNITGRNYSVKRHIYLLLGRYVVLDKMSQKRTKKRANKKTKKGKNTQDWKMSLEKC